MSKDTAEVIAALQEQIAQAEGSSFFDSVKEEAKAPVRRRALLILNQRPQSHQELRNRLLRLDFEESLVDEVLADLARSGLIDDHAFAQQWVIERHRLRGKSRRALDLELQKKGIEASIRHAALAHISEDSEEAIATALARKKAGQVRAVPEDYAQYTKELRKVVGVLARRGFSQSLSMQIARTALADRISELEGKS